MYRMLFSILLRVDLDTYIYSVILLFFVVFWLIIVLSLKSHLSQSFLSIHLLKCCLGILGPPILVLLSLNGDKLLRPYHPITSRVSTLTIHRYKPHLNIISKYLFPINLITYIVSAVNLFIRRIPQSFQILYCRYILRH